VLENDSTTVFPPQFEVFMGAFISRGFGLCRLKRVKLVDSDPPKQGILRTRIPMNNLETFNIRKILKPVYGYLFEPTSLTSGVYVLSLFEGSEVIAPEFLISPMERR
jgi:hypothetical protein